MRNRLINVFSPPGNLIKRSKGKITKVVAFFGHRKDSYFRKENEMKTDGKVTATA